VRGAVKILTDTEIGGVLLPSAIDDKTGDTVEEVLLSKPDTLKMPKYDELPDLVELDIADDIVQLVASQLTGSAGVGGSDSHAVSHWLLRFGEVSKRLRKVFAPFAEWTSNKTPPRAAYRALMIDRLLALHKNPGVRPVGVGGTWRRSLAKCVLKVTGNEAKEACGINQLCAGLEGRIEGGTHAIQHVWDAHHMEEEWGFLLIHARSAFNEQNRTAIGCSLHIQLLPSLVHLGDSRERWLWRCFHFQQKVLSKRNRFRCLPMELASSL
jgi:hypothetical protein